MKAAHFTFVHHEHHHTHHQHDPSFHQTHKKCPFLAYQLIEFYDKTESIPVFANQDYLIFDAGIINDVFLAEVPSAYNLRAPPVTIL